MKVLVTGGAGFIGSHIVDKLLEEHYDVVVIDDLSAGDLNNISNINNIIFYQRNIFTDDISDIFEVEKPDYCIHLAAQTSVTVSIKNPVNDANINVISSIKLANLSKHYNLKKFIVASTAAVYGTPVYIPIDEVHPTNPISFYGLSKLTMEKYIKLLNVPYLIFRFSNVYGERQVSSQESGVVAIFNNAMIKNLPINIYGDGNQIRDFLYVKDIANLMVLSLIQDSMVNTVLNLSSNVGISINELFNKMKNIYKYDLKPNYLPEREGDIQDSILSNKNILKIYPCLQITPLEIGLKNLRNYYQGESNV